ncbi:MAG: protein kinase, partial [Planctomycetota bacterium]
MTNKDEPSPNSGNRAASDSGHDAPDTKALSDEELTRLVDLARPIADASERPSAIGRYEVVRELGRGGMGVVYEARDPALDRHVALKVIADRVWADTDVAERFRHEARIVAQLEHPHVAKVFEAGADYLAMQLIDGHTVAATPPATPKAAAALIRDAARAVHYAHEQGVLHRDLKPQNLMLDASGTHVYVLDFGLARTTASEVSMTGNVVGTPAYMSPEQAQGRSVDARSDVYSLGATLYELLSGRRPYEHPELYELLRRIADDAEPTPLRTHVARIDRDLEVIVHHCLAKDPARRYATAEALAEDLERWLAGEPIAARPPSRVYRFRKLVRRRRGVVAATALGVTAFIVAVSLLLPPLLEERRERANSEQTAILWGELAPLIARAELYQRQGETERADECVTAAMAECERVLASRKLPAAHYFLGRLLRGRGELAPARTALDRAIALDPQLGEAFYERGLLDLQIYSDMLSPHRYLFAADLKHPQPLRTSALALERYFPMLRMKRISA